MLIFFVKKGTVLLVLAVSFYYATQVFGNYKTDTTSISNVAFGFMVALASLSFSMARCLDASDKTRDRLTFAGERLFHASLLLIMASIIKYALLSMQSSAWAPARVVVVTLFNLIMGISAGTCFLFAVLTAHTGILIVNNHLWDRMSRHSDWDNIF